MFNLIFGILLILTGLATGIYFGLWWAFVGGIVDIVNAVTSTPISAMGVAVGVVKMIFASVIGWVCVAIFWVVGMSFLNDVK